MPDVITITVHGQPAPQGSKRAFAIRGRGGVPTGRVAVIESSHDRVKSWRQAVLDATLHATGGEMSPLAGPLAVAMVFILRRPKAHYRTGRNAHLLRDSAPIRPLGAPDLSKLARATEDALTDAVLWFDDAQVVQYDHLAKVWAGGELAPGARITVRRVTS
jgi:Holliday junction resolvase RusA-like endonuclease